MGEFPFYLYDDVITVQRKRPQTVTEECSQQRIATLAPQNGLLSGGEGVGGELDERDVRSSALFEDDESIFAALRAGAQGYVLKDTSEEEMLRAIRAVASGEAIFSPGVANRIIGFFASSRVELPQDVFSDLTNREREILELIARGETNTRIAERLFISLKTVRNHVSNIYSKLQVVDRAQAVIRARNAGMGNG